MPVRPLPPHPNLAYLKSQARDLLKARGHRDPSAAQRIREFHPRFREATDSSIFDAPFLLSDAQLTIARESGFASWPRLKQHTESPLPANDAQLKHQERIADPVFRQAVRLLDAGDVPALRAHLRAHPVLARQRVRFEGGNYFRNPSLLAFVAENPIRQGKLPANIVEIAQAILDAGASQDPVAVTETLELVCSGCVPRQCGVQIPLIQLLCDHGADPDQALPAALVHGEFEAVRALLQHGAQLDLAAAAALGDTSEVEHLLPGADPHQRHRALALAAQFGRLPALTALLDAGEDPNRYNPMGCHSHSTPLHQAALAGHADVVRLLVQRGTQLHLRDTLWKGTPADWAAHAGHSEIEAYLRGQTPP